MLEEKLTREEQKEIALKRLAQLDVFKPYIKAFNEKGIVTFYEGFGGFYATESNGEGELESKIRSFEKETGSLVYAATHEILEFGECYSFLVVSSYREDEWQTELDYESGVFYPFAYVWNKTFEDFSEYGTIGVQSFGGGIRRCC